jgi:hypothetical protein
VAVAALIVSIVAALVTLVGLYFARRAADAATTATNIEKARRHAEMRPRYLVTCEAVNPGAEQRRLLVKLVGPGELEGLDELSVTIRDDSHFRLKPAPNPGQPPESVLDQVWGPLRFVPGTGPGVGTRPGWVGADQAGRTTTSLGMPVGEAHIYALEPNAAASSRILDSRPVVRAGCPHAAAAHRGPQARLGPVGRSRRARDQR